MHSPSPRPLVPGARSERGRSRDCRGSGPGLSCCFRPRSQPPPTSGDSPLEASRDRPYGRTTLPRTFQGTFSAPILWSQLPRGPPPASPDGRFRPTPCPRPAPTCRQRSTSGPSPETSASEAPRLTRCSTAADPARNPAGPRGTPPSQSSPRHGRCRRCFGPREMPDHTPQVRGYPMKLEGPAYPVPGNAVEGVDHVQRHSQRHATAPLGPLNQGADTGYSIGRRPSPPEAKLAVVQSGNTPGQMRLEAGRHHSLQ